MVTRGKIRGNGSQLAGYLVRQADNDNVRVFDIRGTSHPNDLRKSLLEMSLTSELTKSDKGLYHVQICPAYGEDRKMTDKDWLRAAEILEAETGFTGQKRIMVLHDKNGRQHMHVAYERYDHEKGIMKSDSFSRLAQDRARVRMEQEFEQQRTPQRNKHRPELKEELTRLWHETATAQELIKAVEDKGYAIAAGTQRPYMIIDQTGRSFDLARQLNGVRTKEVRERFKETRLVKEKEAIRAVRNRQEIEKMNAAQEKAIDKIMLQEEQAAIRAEREAANDNDKAKAVANDNAKVSKPILSMSGSFQIGHHDTEAAARQMKAALDKEEKRRLEKERIMQALEEEKLRKARDFNNNKKDMGR